VRIQEESRCYSGVPNVLNNRPKIFLNHCLERLPPNVGEITRDDLREVGDFFEVKSRDSAQTYRVLHKPDLPRCSCKDYTRRNWPCKHLLALYQFFPLQSLTNYFNNPLFSVDRDVIGDGAEVGISEETGNSVEITSQEIRPGREPSAIRKDVLCSMTQIENFVFATDDIDVLKSSLEKMKDLEEFLHDRIPKMAGLPLRQQNRKWKRTSGMTFKKKKRTSKKTKKIIDKDIINESLNTIDKRNTTPNETNERIDSDITEEIIDENLTDNLQQGNAKYLCSEKC